MAALNHAVMIPGLIIVIILFWAWMPIWAIVWCIRRIRGKKLNDEEKLQTGHIPHKGFEPPPGADYVPPQVAQRQFVAPVSLRTTRHHSHHNATKMQRPEIKTDEARRQQQVEKRVAPLKQQERREKQARRERKESDARRKEKGKELALSVSGESRNISRYGSGVTAPENVVIGNSSRHHHSRR